MKPEDLARALEHPIHEVEHLAHETHQHYRKWWEVKRDKQGRIKRRNGKIERRQIIAPSEELKALQRSLKSSIFDVIKLPQCVYGTKGTSNVANAEKHRGKRYHFSTDIRNFFPSIKANQIYKALRDLNFSPTVARLIRDLVTYSGRLPQGAPTSNQVANLVFLQVDLKLQKYATEKALVYTRYVDDLTFSSAYDFKHLCPNILEIIRRHGFRIHDRKTGYKVGPSLATGVIVKQNSLEVPKHLKERLEDPELPLKVREGLESYKDQVKRAYNHQ